MKQTAVEWLVENSGLKDNLLWQEVIKQAKEMEKEHYLEIGLLKIELEHTKRLLASCEKALEDRDNKYK